MSTPVQSTPDPYQSSTINPLQANALSGSEKSVDSNNPYIMQGNELFSATQLPKVFLLTIFSGMFEDIKNFKKLEDFQSLFLSKNESNISFEEAFSKHALDQVLKTGQFNSNQAFSSWSENLDELNQTSKQMSISVNNMNPVIQLRETGPNSTNEPLSGASATAKIDLTDSTSESTDPFAVLARVLALIAEANTNFLTVASTLAVTSNNLTDELEYYANLLENLKPADPNIIGGEDMDDGKAVVTEEQIEAADSYNALYLTPATSKVQGWVETTQNEAKSVQTQMTAMTDNAKSYSNKFSDILSSLSTMTMSIFR